jgi:hypothetical protein
MMDTQLHPTIRVALLSLGLLAVQPAFAGDGMLCQPQEKVIFSCPLKNSKIVSLCVSANPALSFVEYRFGKPAKPELLYRASGEDKDHLFHRAEVLYGNNSVDNIWFANGKYIYSINMPARGAPGVEVWKNGDIVANMECKDGWRHATGDEDTKSTFIMDHDSVDAGNLKNLWFPKQSR